MPDDVFIVAQVLDLRPDAVYRDKVYTQFVDLGNKDGIMCTAYDSMRVKDEHLNQICKIWLATFLGKNYLQEHINQLATESRGTPVNDLARAQNRLTLAGEVFAIDAGRNTFILDTALGKMLCDGIAIEPSDSQSVLSTRPLKLGDRVFHYATRIDLTDIKCSEKG